MVERYRRPTFRPDSIKPSVPGDDDSDICRKIPLTPELAEARKRASALPPAPRRETTPPPIDTTRHRHAWTKGELSAVADQQWRESESDQREIRLQVSALQEFVRAFNQGQRYLEPTESVYALKEGYEEDLYDPSANADLLRQLDGIFTKNSELFSIAHNHLRVLLNALSKEK